MTLATLKRRLDAQALDQLRTAAAAHAITTERQEAEISRLKAALKDAELLADIWREDALDYMAQLAEQTGQHVGLTPCGKVLVIPQQQVPA